MFKETKKDLAPASQRLGFSTALHVAQTWVPFLDDPLLRGSWSSICSKLLGQKISYGENAILVDGMGAGVRWRRGEGEIILKLKTGVMGYVMSALTHTHTFIY